MPSTKADTLYAVLLNWPENGRLDIPLRGLEERGQPVSGVDMIGTDAPLPFTQSATSLAVALPREQPGPHAWVLRIRPAPPPIRS
jgi:alpha-L-fucosidase